MGCPYSQENFPPILPKRFLSQEINSGLNKLAFQPKSSKKDTELMFLHVFVLDTYPANCGVKKSSTHEGMRKH